MVIVNSIQFMALKLKFQEDRVLFVMFFAVSLNPRTATRISGSLSCGAREVRSPCAWRGGARPGSRVTGGD